MVKVDDLKPGNPLRVACRTCRAVLGVACSWSADQRHPEFHKKRVRDARQDYIANSPPAIVGVRQTRAGRRIMGELGARSWRKTQAETRAREPIAKLGDMAGAERALSMPTLDINTPAFWNAVWRESKP